MPDPADPVGPSAAPNRDLLREKARAFESAFIAEMLRAAHVGDPRASFGGGAGEEEFASFLLRAEADEIARAGGFGLAESIYRALNQEVENPNAEPPE